MSSRSAKSRALKRKTDRLLREIETEEAVYNIVHAPKESRSSASLEEQNLEAGPELPQAQYSTVLEDEHLHWETNWPVYESVSDDSHTYSVYDGTNSDEIISKVGSNSSSETGENLSDENCYLAVPVSSAEEDDIDDRSTSEKLRDWVVSCKVPRSTVTKLLKILQPLHPNELPSDSRTLLRTCRNADIEHIDVVGVRGTRTISEFKYFGVVTGLQKFDLRKLCPDSVIKLKFNIDGLPLFKSANTQLWPILCQLVCSCTLPPFTVACYYGTSKPASIEKYFESFVAEMSVLFKDGMIFDNVNYKVLLHSFLCDAPARAFVKGIKNHSGYYGCERCIQKGSYVSGRVVFSEMNSILRTDDSVAMQVNKEHHVCQTPLSALNIGLVSNFPLDSMHLIHLGVMRKLLLLLLRNGGVARISQGQAIQISERLLIFRKCTPTEFNRLPRSLKEIDRWKATEFRHFLLYFGPIALRNIISEKLYKHFLLLHVAVSLLSDVDLSLTVENVEYARKLINVFVEEMTALYGPEFQSYNVHSLLHVPDDVVKYGSLDNISCFPFENYLGWIKSLIHSPNLPLSQLCKRLSEESRPMYRGSKSKKLKYPHSNGPTLNISGTQFVSLAVNGSTINIKRASDKFVSLKNKMIVKVCNIIEPNEANEIQLICEEMLKIGDVYSFPCSSQLIGIMKVDLIPKQGRGLFAKFISDVSRKCIVFTENTRPTEGCAIVLNHSFFLGEPTHSSEILEVNHFNHEKLSHLTYLFSKL